jgi:hypothetical protein
LVNVAAEMVGCVAPSRAEESPSTATWSPAATAAADGVRSIREPPAEFCTNRTSGAAYVTTPSRWTAVVFADRTCRSAESILAVPSSLVSAPRHETQHRLASAMSTSRPVVERRTRPLSLCSCIIGRISWATTAQSVVPGSSTVVLTTHRCAVVEPGGRHAHTPPDTTLASRISLNEAGKSEGQLFLEFFARRGLP